MSTSSSSQSSPSPESYPDDVVQKSLVFNYYALPPGETTSSEYSHTLCELGPGHRACLIVATTSNRLFYLVLQHPTLDFSVATKESKPSESTKNCRFQELVPNQSRSSEIGDIVSLAAVVNHTTNADENEAAKTSEYLNRANIKDYGFLATRNPSLSLTPSVSLVVGCALTKQAQNRSQNANGDDAMRETDQDDVGSPTSATAVTSSGRSIPTTTSDVSSSTSKKTSTKASSSDSHSRNANSPGSRGTLLLYTMSYAHTGDSGHSLTECCLQDQVPIQYAPYQCAPCPTYIADLALNCSKSDSHGQPNTSSESDDEEVEGVWQRQSKGTLKRNQRTASALLQCSGAVVVCGTDGIVHCYCTLRQHAHVPERGVASVRGRSRSNPSLQSNTLESAQRKYHCHEVPNFLCKSEGVYRRQRDDAPICVGLSTTRSHTGVTTCGLVGYRSGDVELHQLEVKLPTSSAGVATSDQETRWRCSRKLYERLLDGPILNMAVRSQPLLADTSSAGDNEIIDPSQVAVIANALGQVAVCGVELGEDSTGLKGLTLYQNGRHHVLPPFIRNAEVVTCAVLHQMCGDQRPHLVVGTLHGHLYVFHDPRSGDDRISTPCGYKLILTKRFAQPILGLYSADFLGGGSRPLLAVCTAAGVHMSR